MGSIGPFAPCICMQGHHKNLSHVWLCECADLVDIPMIIYPYPFDCISIMMVI